MDLMDRWVTLTLTNQTPVSALTAGLLGSREAMKTFWGMGGWLRRKGVKIKNNLKKKEQREETGEGKASSLLPESKKKEEKNKCLVGKEPERKRDRRLQSFDLHHFTLWPLAAIKDTREVLMR